MNGISWDHANVFPTLDIYLDQFKKLINKTSKGGSIIIYDGDHNIDKIIINPEEGKSIIKYNIHKNEIKNDKTYLISNNKKIPIKIFGDHNMQNISAAKTVCDQLGIKNRRFFKAISSYKLPENRLQIRIRSNTFSRENAKIEIKDPNILFDDSKLATAIAISTVEIS